ncbi:MAG: hypothetical protein JSV83_02295, partial [Desulfobacterales bacterium]
MPDNKAIDKPIWKKFFKGYEKCVRIVPQSAHDLGDERQKIQYPLTKMIANGELSKFKMFRSFKKGNTLILNNLKLPILEVLRKKMGWSTTNKRPDLIAITNEGDTLVIECKQRNDKNIDRAVKAFITLKYFADNFPVKIKGGSINRPLDKCNYFYNQKYMNKGFDDFNSTLSKLFSIKSFNERNDWAEKVRKNIANNKLKYGFAIDEKIGQYKSKNHKYT